MNSSSAIGVGIIGLSAKRGWASVAHLPALAALPEFELRALSASSPESARAAATQYDIATACSDAQELVNRDDVDLVVVTVKVRDHHDLVTAALNAGKAVLCEWPLGNGLEEARQLAALAARTGVPTFCGLQARSAPPVRYLRDLVANGAIGTVLSTSVIASGLRWGESIDSSRIYLLDRDNGATMMTIPFSHAVDGLCHVLGQFSSLSATTAVVRPTIRLIETGEILTKTAEDQIAIHGVLDGGAIASVHFRAGMSSATNFLWEINGTEGDIVVRGPSGHLQYGFISIEMSTASQGLQSLRVPSAFCLTPTDPNSYAHAVAEAYAQIALDIGTGSRIVPTFDDALMRHRFLASIETSSATGTRVAHP